jgi:hypothetical protein
LHRRIWKKISPQDTEEILLYYTEGLRDIEVSLGERSACSVEAGEGQDTQWCLNTFEAAAGFINLSIRNFKNNPAIEVEVELPPSRLEMPFDGAVHRPSLSVDPRLKRLMCVLPCPAATISSEILKEKNISLAGTNFFNTIFIPRSRKILTQHTRSQQPRSQGNAGILRHL